MNISVKVRRLVSNSKPLKAVCSVTVDGSYVTHGVKVIETESKTFIAMPSELWKDAEGNDKFRDVCHPINAETRKAMQEAVLSAYNKSLEEDRQAADTPA